MRLGSFCSRSRACVRACVGGPWVVITEFPMRKRAWGDMCWITLYVAFLARTCCCAPAVGVGNGGCLQAALQAFVKLVVHFLGGAVRGRCSSHLCTRRDFNRWHGECVRNRIVGCRPPGRPLNVFIEGPRRRLLSSCLVSLSLSLLVLTLPCALQDRDRPLASSSSSSSLSSLNPASRSRLSRR